MMQRSFDDVPMIVSASEPHMALLWLVDVSGSMSGAAINSLNAALNTFKTQVCEDAHTTEILDVAVVAFNHEVNVVLPFTPVAHMPEITLQATGGTVIEPAAHVAMDMVQERSRFYRGTGTEPYKPWIFLISDGAGGDVTQAGQRVRELEEAGVLKFFSLGVEGYDSNTLHTLCGEQVLKLNGFDFSGIFDWAHKSMRAVSVSSPGDKVSMPLLPDSVDKDVGGWF